jgi:hypothetical protein
VAVAFWSQAGVEEKEEEKESWPAHQDTQGCAAPGPTRVAYRHPHEEPARALRGLIVFLLFHFCILKMFGTQGCAAPGPTRVAYRHPHEEPARALRGLIVFLLFHFCILKTLFKTPIFARVG